MAVDLVCPKCGHRLTVFVRIKRALHNSCPKRGQREAAPEYREEAGK